MKQDRIYDALILDVDGTLWDITSYAKEAYDRGFFEIAGKRVNISADDLKKEFGKPTEEISKNMWLKYAGSELPERDLILKLRDACDSMTNEALLGGGGTAYPGVVETLRRLSKVLPVYVVSNCQKCYIDICLKNIGAAQYISGQLCYGETGLGKADNIRILCERFGVREPVYIGDILADADASLAAGADFIWASYGYGSVPEDRYVLKAERFSDLLPFFGRQYLARSFDAAPLAEPARPQYFCEKLAAYRTAFDREDLSCCVTTFGCQMNARDSEKLTGILEQAGYRETDSEAEADVVVFNTCTVRENANEHLYGRLGRLKAGRKENPDRIIVLCGCMMQEEAEIEKIRRAYPYVDIIFGTHNVYALAELLFLLFLKRNGGFRDFYASDEVLADSGADAAAADRLLRFGTQKNLRQYEKILRRPVVSVLKKSGAIVEELPQKRKYHFRQGVNILFGCDNFCSYCIVPYVRGREKSREPEDILKEVRALGRDGVKEIMLLGQNVNSYGKTLREPVGFPELLRRIDEAADETGIGRIRFMTSHPKDLSDELIRVLAEGKHIMHQFHLPLQSGSDALLKRMNRHYGRAYYLGLVEKLREAVPDISLSTDIMVGFPGETEEDFEATLDVVRKAQYDQVFSFIYSPREGTPAASMKDPVPKEVTNARFERLLTLQGEIAAKRFRALEGRVMPVLFEETDAKDPGLLTGRLESNAVVHVPGDASLIGSILPVRLVRAHGFYFTGELFTET